MARAVGARAFEIMKKSAVAFVVHQAIYESCKTIKGENPSYDLLVVTCAEALTYIMLTGKRKDFTRFDQRVKSGQLVAALQKGLDAFNLDEWEQNNENE